MVIDAITAVPPTVINFLKENSNPMANKRNITPMSAHIFILAGSDTVGI